MCFFSFPIHFFPYQWVCQEGIENTKLISLASEVLLIFFFFLLVANLLQTWVYSSPTQELELPDGYRNVDCGKKASHGNTAVYHSAVKMQEAKIN